MGIPFLGPVFGIKNIIEGIQEGDLTKCLKGGAKISLSLLTAGTADVVTTTSDVHNVLEIAREKFLS
jgi:hypothetical protein